MFCLPDAASLIFLTELFINLTFKTFDNLTMGQKIFNMQFFYVWDIWQDQTWNSVRAMLSRKILWKRTFQKVGISEMGVEGCVSVNYHQNVN